MATSPASDSQPFDVQSLAAFDEPWALAVEPGTGAVFVAQRPGGLKRYDPQAGTLIDVAGAPSVAYGGQGGFADVAFAPDYATSHAIYLSWAEAAGGDKTDGVVGRGTLSCTDPAAACRIEGLQVIWRQTPTIEGKLQYALRLAFSPDGGHLFVASGDRRAIDLVQSLDSNIGKVVRLLPDGKPAPGNPFAAKGGPANEIWTIGHRNPLGLAFDPQGQLWDVEHGPAGGDELNLLREGDNYGWPLVSNGDNYDGSKIPRHATRPDFHAPAISWSPVIAPGGMIFYTGSLWPQWQGQALIAGLKTKALVRVRLDGDRGTEEARYDMGKRMRAIAQAPDGGLYMLEDGKGGRLLKLTPHTN